MCCSAWWGQGADHRLYSFLYSRIVQSNNITHYAPLCKFNIKNNIS